MYNANCFGRAGVEICFVYIDDVEHYLGYTISKNGIAPDQDKTSKIRIYPVPTDVGNQVES